MGNKRCLKIFGSEKFVSDEQIAWNGNAAKSEACAPSIGHYIGPWALYLPA